jgi:hypothetical protein
MPRSLDPMHQPTAMRRIYVDVPVATAEAFKVRAAQERMHMNQLVAKLMQEYVSGKTKGK